MGPAPQTKAKKKQKAPPTPAPAPQSDDPWFIPAIQCYEPEDGVFFAQIGPTGGDNGYSAITGHVGWGISWYINGLLIPEIYVVRGKTYTFVVEGGDDKEFAAGYHPFYITDDPEGGYEFKSAKERRKSKVLAGVEQTRFGGTVPTATGRLCEWKEDPRQPFNEEHYDRKNNHNRRYQTRPYMQNYNNDDKYNSNNKYNYDNMDNKM